MGRKKNLFDTDASLTGFTDKSEHKSANIKKEVPPLDRLKNLEEKITTAVEKVKALKDEKTLFERKIKDLENLVNQKDQEIQEIKSEKSSIKNQVEELLNELETIEL
jgi:chromosome segregation ATPase